ncbi:MAG: hypothetical protein KDK23_04990 [Leptospiraceae bacterium]|nr:hypothetical protein [Leptospiraceae bacterium]MCB1168170.1 hypothetical protein [Leptospiraceae bacterium]
MKKKILFYALMIGMVFLFIRAADYLIYYVFLRYNTSFVLMPRNDETMGTNSLGLRGPEPSPSADESLGLFIGDSFTMGMGVPEKNSYVRITEKKLLDRGLKVEHMNAGIAGYSPANSLGLLEHLGTDQSIDYVVFTLYSNDIFDLGDNVFLSALLNKELNKPHVAILYFVAPRITSYFYYSQLAALGNQLSLNNNLTLDRVHKNLQSEEQRSPAPAQPAANAQEEPTGEQNLKLMLFMEQIRKLALHADISESAYNEWMRKNQKNVSLAIDGKINLVEVLTPLFFPEHFEQCIDLSHGGEEKFTILKEILLRMKAYANQKEARFILVFIPADVRYSKEKWDLAKSYGYVMKEDWLTGQSELEKRLVDFTEEHDIAYLPLTEELRQMDKQGIHATFPRDIHLNSTGHSAVADPIADFLEQELRSTR